MCVLQSTPPVFFKKRTTTEGVNAANEKDFLYKAMILYIPYGQTLRNV